MHLMIDALPIQPCNPTCMSRFTCFLYLILIPLSTVLTGRDAIIQADANRYSGANKCTLWKAFASRGLGVNAANHVNDTTLPSGC